MLRAYGAEVVVCPSTVSPDHPDSYYSVARRLARETPDAWQPDQYANPDNPAAHYHSTGPEIWAQTEGKITHFVVGHRHRRHDLRHRPLPEGEVRQQGKGHRRGPGGLGVLRRRRPPLPRGRRRRGHLADHLRQGHRRRGDRGERRRLVPHDPAAGPRGGAARRRLGRARRRRRPQGRRQRRSPTTSSSSSSPTAAAATCRRSSTTTGWPTTGSCAPRRPSPPSRTCWPPGTMARMPALVHIHPDETVAQAIALLREYDVSQLPVVRPGAPADGRRGRRGRSPSATCSTPWSAAARDPRIRSADHMVPPLPVVGQGEPVSRAAAALEKRAPRSCTSTASPPPCSPAQDLLAYYASTPMNPGDGTMKFETQAIHAGQDPDPLTGAVVPPIYQTSTYKQDGVGGTRGGYEYSRSGNPTRNALEECLAALENGAAAFAFASGMAAEDCLLRTLCRPGDHVLIPADAYGGTFRLFDKVLSRWGVSYETVRQDRSPSRRPSRGEQETQAHLGRDSHQPAAVDHRHPGARPRSRTGTGRCSSSTTRSPRRTCSGRSTWARTSWCTAPPSTSAGTPTSSAVR